MKNRFLKMPFVLAGLLIMLLAGCSKIKDNRVPMMQVNIALNTSSMWELYGVHGYGDYKKFIRHSHIPANFPYNANTYTGFGGVLLISGYDFTTQDYNSPLAYDLACPYEVRANVLLEIDRENFEAYCPQCGSRFNVTEGSGIPVSGPAYDHGYGMLRYNVRQEPSGGYVITN